MEAPAHFAGRLVQTMEAGILDLEARPESVEEDATAESTTEQDPW